MDMSARLRMGRAIAAALFAGLLVVSQPGRVDAQGNGNGVANRVAALKADVANLTARVAPWRLLEPNGGSAWISSRIRRQSELRRRSSSVA
jgi:hypothetical protein